MNNRRQKSCSAETHRRSGLAPLELVMIAPLLVFMGALMLNFGDAALFKIRAQTTVHYAGTQTESFRASTYDLDNQQLNPRPTNWPTPATIGTGSSGELRSVQNQYWNQSGYPETEALQGSSGSGSQTILVDPYMGNQFLVNRTMILERGMHAGRVTVRRRFPMLSLIMPGNGEFRIDHDYEFLQGDWNFQHVELGSNRARRVDHLYDVDPDEMPQLASLWNGFIAAFQQLQANPTKQDLNPLDDDDEFRLYTLSAPNFHPHPSGCELEFSEYLDSGQYSSYLQRIRGVPRRMANAWIRMYRNELARRQANPPFPPRGTASDIELETKINQLQAYLEALTNRGY